MPRSLFILTALSVLVVPWALFTAGVVRAFTDAAKGKGVMSRDREPELTALASDLHEAESRLATEPERAP